MDWKALLWPWGRIRELLELSNSQYVTCQKLRDENEKLRDENRNLLTSVGRMADSYEQMTSDIHQAKLKADIENRGIYQTAKETEKAVQFIADGVQQWLEARNAEVVASVDAMYTENFLENVKAAKAAKDAKAKKKRKGSR